MADLWEICRIDSSSWFVYSPSGYKEKNFDFLGGNNIPKQNEKISELLAQGWEPYAVDNGTHYFRRHIS